MPSQPPLEIPRLTIPEVAGALALRAPRTEPSEQANRRAAVAMILRRSPESGLETLFIQRAHHPLDPWSGHMAFPGGHQDPADATLEAAVRRETFEEIGLSLREESLIGRLHDLSGGRLRPINMSVSPFVYAIEEAPPLSLNREEVADAVWVPLGFLADPANIQPYAYPRDPAGRSFPSFQFGPDTIWGMTYRMVGDFLEIFGVHVPHESPMTEAE